MTTMTRTSFQTKKSFIRKRPVLSFFTLAIVITWMFALPPLLLGRSRPSLD